LKISSNFQHSFFFGFFLSKNQKFKKQGKNVSERLVSVLIDMSEQDPMECNTSNEKVLSESYFRTQLYRDRLRQNYLIELTKKTRISLIDSWPQVEHCHSKRTGVCACGLQREMNLSMEVEGGLVVVELDYKKHQTCGRSCEAAVYAPLALEGKGRLVVVRFRHWGTGESFHDRLLKLRKAIGSCCFKLRKGIGFSGVEVVHVCFPLSVRNYEISVGGGGAPAEMAVETAVETGAGAPVVAAGVACGGVSAKRQKKVMTNLEYFDELGRSRKVFVNKERRRLEYEHSGERERLLAVEKWVLEKTCIMHPELRQTESLFTGLCTCGKLRYTNVWTETDLSPKSLIVVELDAHEHLSCTRGRESERYMGLRWKLDMLVVVVRWNSVGHEDTAERAQDLNKVLLGVRDRIFEGENVNDVEVVHAYRDRCGGACGGCWRRVRRREREAAEEGYDESGVL
jgi:hypothetical protein